VAAEQIRAEPARADPGALGTRVDLDDVAPTYVVGTTTVTALHDISLHIDENAFVVVLGPSGSGKTTLLNLMGALDTATAGTVRINGVDLTRASPAERRRVRRVTVSFIVQTFNIFPGLTAAENVRFGADAAGRADAQEVAAAMLERVGLADRGRHFPYQLSGGEQQRVAIARALATGNPILLADEPTGELDFRTGVAILELLATQAQSGTTVVVVTHNREISRIANRVVELSSGTIVADGPPRGGQAPISELRW
jgi:putative ABC transport system ATP-binding protein